MDNGFAAGGDMTVSQHRSTRACAEMHCIDAKEGGGWGAAGGGARGVAIDANQAAGDEKALAC